MWMIFFFNRLAWSWRYTFFSNFFIVFFFLSSWTARNILIFYFFWISFQLTINTHTYECCENPNFLNVITKLGAIYNTHTHTIRIINHGDEMNEQRIREKTEHKKLHNIESGTF